MMSSTEAPDTRRSGSGCAHADGNIGFRLPGFLPTENSNSICGNVLRKKHIIHRPRQHRAGIKNGIHPVSHTRRFRDGPE